jgi:hypothetical protein
MIQLFNKILSPAGGADVFRFFARGLVLRNVALRAAGACVFKPRGALAAHFTGP